MEGNFSSFVSSFYRGGSTYYINKEAELKGMAIDASIEALEKDESLLNQVVRQGEAQDLFGNPMV